MPFSSDDDQQGLVLGLVLVVAALVVALVLVVALNRPGGQPPAVSTAIAAPAVQAQPVAAAPGPTAQAISDAASITVEYGVVKFYFASGKAELAPGAGEALVDVVKAAKGGRKVVIAGFHDLQGNPEANAELARRRAIAVRDALRSAGVPDGQVTLQKPRETTGSGSDAEARRVEITLQ